MDDETIDRERLNDLTPDWLHFDAQCKAATDTLMVWYRRNGEVFVGTRIRAMEMREQYVAEDAEDAAEWIIDIAPKMAKALRQEIALELEKVEDDIDMMEATDEQ
jgi:hypothetical protein